ncbi:organellar and viral DNA polymerase type B, partial [Trichomonas vaginalis G3]|uniref:organellar and viral DNA polymerase type B n=1 Tax=Trichomonas vaginalis (strain ATCC PRA-98 / G3) TaxID=412133 RepID=UPI0021E5F38C
IFMNFPEIKNKVSFIFFIFLFCIKDMISTIGTTTIQAANGGTLSTTTAPNSLVMNPTSMLVEMKNFIPSSYTFETKIQKIKQEL